MHSGKSSTNKSTQHLFGLSSAQKVALNTSKELAERHLDVSPGSLTIQRDDRSPGYMDHRQVAAKVVMGSHLIDYELSELCQIHKGEMLIARDEDNPECFGCNKCVFERKLTKPVFMAYQAKQTKSQIDTRYQKLSSNLREAGELEPDLYQQKIQEKISDYFINLHNLVSQIEKEVTHQLKNSQSLAGLKNALSQLHHKLNANKMDRLQEEKFSIDSKIESQRYAYVARRKEHYHQVTQDLDQINDFIAKNVEDAKFHASNLLDAKFLKPSIYQGVFDVIKGTISIDRQPVKSKGELSLSNQRQQEIEVDQTGQKAVAPFQINEVDVEMKHEEQKQEPIDQIFFTSFTPNKPEINKDENHVMNESSKQSFGLTPQKHSPVAKSKMMAPTPQVINQSPAIKNVQSIFNEPIVQSIFNVPKKNEKENPVAPNPTPNEIHSVSEEDSQDVPKLEYFYTAGVQHRNHIIGHSFQDGETAIVLKVPQQMFTKPKIIQIASGRLFIIGGSVRDHQVSGKCYEVKIAKGASQERTQFEERASMLNGRNGYACCVSVKQIYTAGGLFDKQVPTVQVEAYNTDFDKWQSLPNLPQPLYSSGLSCFNQSQLILVGGINESHKHVGTIMKLNLNPLDSNWKVLNVAMPSPLTNVGIHQSAIDRLIIFGGWNAEHQKNIFALKELHQGFTLQKLSKVMDQADSFTVNGLSVRQGSDYLICGQNQVHSLDDRNGTFKVVREIRKM